MLHEGGVASSWAARAAVGDRLGVAGPRGSHVLTSEMDGFVLVGDETALPAIHNWLATIGSGIPTRVFVEVADDRERQSLRTQGDITTTWHTRMTDAGFGLLDAIRAADLPTGRIFHRVAD